MEGKQCDVLLGLSGLLTTLGSANDAEDHGYREDADRMRQESCESIKKLLVENAFLGVLIPSLEEELSSGHIFNFGWANLRQDVEAAMKSSGKLNV